MATDLTALDGNISLSAIFATQKGLDLSTPADSLNISKILEYAFGTGAGKADQIWHDRRVLAASADEDLDLAGVLTNWAGATVTFANIKAIIVINRSDETTTSPAHTATDASITVGGAAATQFVGPLVDATDKVQVEAGGVFLVATKTAAGWTVTAATADLLNIANEDGVDEALYDIVLVGEAA